MDKFHPLTNRYDKDGKLVAQGLSERMGVSYRTLIRYIENGTLKARRFGRGYFVPEKEIENFMQWSEKHYGSDTDAE